MPAPPYTLVAVVGMSPQVVTETIFELHRLSGDQPATVHLVTTRIGAAITRARLLGERVRNPLTGAPVPHAEDRWTPFCETVLGRPPIPLEWHVAEANGQALDDIRERGDDTCFSDLCYELVERLTRPDELPLVGSIAGGRKTMSAHLMTAFSVYARPDDRLTHVLVADPDLERAPDFYYPAPGSPDYGRLIDVVDVRFPRLRPILEADLIDTLPSDRRDLQGILDALEPHEASARAVEALTLELRPDGPRLVFEADGAVIDTCALTSKQAATLAAVAEALAGPDDRVPATTFIGSEAVEARRAAVASLCAREPFTPWTSAVDVSKAISDLNDALGAVPLATRTLRIEGISSSPRLYGWPAPLPAPLTVATPYPDEPWPFEQIPALEPLSPR